MKMMPNTEIKKHQQWVLMGILAIMAVVLLIIVLVLKHHSHRSSSKAEPNLAGLTTSTDFVHTNQESAILTQQQDMDHLRQQIVLLKKSLAHVKSTQGRLGDEVKQQVASHQDKENIKNTKNKKGKLSGLNQLSPDNPKGAGKTVASQHAQMQRHSAQSLQGSPFSENAGSNLGALGTRSVRPMGYGEVSLQNFTYKQIKIPITRSPKNYVPSGSFAKAVILGGADADASVNGQSDTSELLLRILDNGTLPGGAHSHLKNCTALASVYGDISSERGIVRLQSLSCTFNWTLDKS